jgi:hypothetical protein
LGDLPESLKPYFKTSARERFESDFAIITPVVKQDLVMMQLEDLELYDKDHINDRTKNFTWTCQRAIQDFKP